MTYLMGLKSGNSVIIASDSRTTGAVTHNFVSKIGILFPGCIFGICGSARDGAVLLSAIKESTSPTNPVERNWSSLQRIIAAYSYPVEALRHFQILLSTRASGTPQLWLLDSRSGLRRVDSRNGIITLGSGKDVLDEFVHEKINSLTQAVSKTPIASRPLVPIPFMLCFSLFRKFHLVDRFELEKLGVGGGFHYIYQTDKTEGGQPPSIYVLVDLDTSKELMVWWMTRVMYVQDGFLLELFTPQGQVSADHPGSFDRLFLVNPLIGSPFGSIVKGEVPSHWQAKIQKVLNAGEAEPFYRYCGFASVDPERQNKSAYFPRLTDKTPYVINRDLEIDSSNIQFVYKLLYA